MPKEIIGIKKYKLVSEDELPTRLRKSSQQWVETLESIPKGQAIETTREDLGLHEVSVRNIIRKLKDAKLLDENYYVTTREQGGVRKIYIVHSAHNEA